MGSLYPFLRKKRRNVEQFGTFLRCRDRRKPLARPHAQTLTLTHTRRFTAKDHSCFLFEQPGGCFSLANRSFVASFSRLDRASCCQQRGLLRKLVGDAQVFFRGRTHTHREAAHTPVSLCSFHGRPNTTQGKHVMCEQ